MVLICTVEKAKRCFFINTKQRIYQLRAKDEDTRDLWLSLVAVFHGAAQSQGIIPIPPRAAVAILSCIAFLLKYGTRKQGVFRINAKSESVDTLYLRLLSKEISTTSKRSKEESLERKYRVFDPSSVLHSIHSSTPVDVVANVLNRFLRELPETILSSSLYDEIMAISQNDSDLDEHFVVDQLSSLLSQLPFVNQYVLCKLADLMFEIAQNVSQTEMTVNNLSICVGPCILRKDTDPSKSGIYNILPFFSLLVHHRLHLFSEDVRAGKDTLSLDRSEVGEIPRLPIGAYHEGASSYMDDNDSLSGRRDITTSNDEDGEIEDSEFHSPDAKRSRDLEDLAEEDASDQGDQKHGEDEDEECRHDTDLTDSEAEALAFSKKRRDSSEGGLNGQKQGDRQNGSRDKKKVDGAEKRALELEARLLALEEQHAQLQTRYAEDVLNMTAKTEDLLMKSKNPNESGISSVLGDDMGAALRHIETSLIMAEVRMRLAKDHRNAMREKLQFIASDLPNESISMMRTMGVAPEDDPRSVRHREQVMSLALAESAKTPARRSPLAQAPRISQSSMTPSMKLAYRGGPTNTPASSGRGVPSPATTRQKTSSSMLSPYPITHQVFLESKYAERTASASKYQPSSSPYAVQVNGRRPATEPRYGSKRVLSSPHLSPIQHAQRVLFTPQAMHGEESFRTLDGDHPDETNVENGAEWERTQFGTTGTARTRPPYEFRSPFEHPYTSHRDTPPAAIHRSPEERSDAYRLHSDFTTPNTVESDEVFWSERDSFWNSRPNLKKKLRARS